MSLLGSALAVQWLKLHASPSGNMGSTPGQGPKTLHGTECGQKTKNINNNNKTRPHPCCVLNASMAPILCLGMGPLCTVVHKVNVKSLSRARLSVTSWSVVYQAPPSMAFPRQEYWSGLPFPSPVVHKAPGNLASLSCLLPLPSPPRSLF